MSIVEPQPAVTSEGGSRKRHNPWIWISALLAVAAVGLGIWGAKTNSDLDSSQQDVARLQSEVDKSKQTGGTVLTAAKSAVQGLAQQLGVTQADLAGVEQELQDAQQKAAQDQAAAQAAADKAKATAGNAADKAQAATDQAKAEAQAAQSKAAVAADCARAYASAFGSLFEGSSVREQASAVKQQVQSISAGCKTALAGQ